jgi:hypothetical protein
MCVAGNATQGTSCKIPANCPTSMYCAPNKTHPINSTCQSLVKEGNPCVDHDSCVWGMGCFNGSFSRCLPYFSLSDGSSLLNKDAQFCQSGNVEMISGVFYCMPARKSITSTTQGQAENLKCFYHIFNNTQNIQTSSVASSPNVCGFTDDGLAYCPQRLGDRQYQAWLKNMKAYHTTPLNCSTYNATAFSIDVNCKDF